MHGAAVDQQCGGRSCMPALLPVMASSCPYSGPPPRPQAGGGLSLRCRSGVGDFRTRLQGNRISATVKGCWQRLLGVPAWPWRREAESVAAVRRLLFGPPRGASLFAWTPIRAHVYAGVEPSEPRMQRGSVRRGFRDPLLHDQRCNDTFLSATRQQPCRVDPRELTTCTRYTAWSARHAGTLPPRR